ncbi:hypothetical protein C9I86_16650 [Photobacterium sp. NCIMB 13483]|uniref:Wzz/FepE/Etk N-terminal domain-containing protein n=1 Tax=Photobacterium sp. NCIMB 13483 TaxID=2022103 RepID=UPI000D154662|nr:Wzz/FepE/Etk N-terminal domain-containing protein [Photobacterium sp. NCIMB 13483]PST85864.1 hypothetical protein C9I86_16650 [Photobacterium sp. NCIMB 13483]
MKNQYNHDEIDFLRLFNILLEGKKIILLCAIIFSAISFLYVSNSKPYWTSQLLITKLNNKNESLKQKPVTNLFVILNNDNNINDINKLNNILDGNIILKKYVTLFNSIENKKSFFYNDKMLSEKLKYKDFLENIKILPYGKGTYKITLKMTNKKESYDLLASYVNYISIKTNESLNKEINVMIDENVDYYKQEKYILELIANGKLQLDIDKTSYELGMIDDNNISKLNNRSSYFLIDSLKRKIDFLKTFRNLNVFEPQLIIVNAKLEVLKNINIKNSSFDEVGVVKIKGLTTTRNNYNATVIALFSSIIGIIFGCLIVLIRYVFKKQ